MNIHEYTCIYIITHCYFTDYTDTDFSMWESIYVMNTLIHHMDAFSPPNNCFHSSAHKSCQCPYSIFLSQNQDEYNNHIPGANPGFVVRTNGSSTFILIPLFMVFIFSQTAIYFRNEESMSKLDYFFFVC